MKFAKSACWTMLAPMGLCAALGGCSAQPNAIKTHAAPPALATRYAQLTSAEREVIGGETPSSPSMTQMYARDNCVTLAEAERRMAIQGSNVAGNLQQRLRAGEASTFAGLWVEHQPEYRVKVAFTRDAAATLARYTRDPLFVPVERSGTSETELLAETRRVVDDLVGAGIGFTSASPDIMTGRGEVNLAVERDEALAAARSAHIRIPDYIDLVAPPPLKVAVPAPFPGGAARLAAFPRAKFRRSGISLLMGSGRVQPYVRNGCLVLDTEDGPVTILWPYEATPDLSRNGVIEIVDRSNGVRFAIGDAIAVEDGVVFDTTRVPAIDENARCPAPYAYVSNFSPWKEYEEEQLQSRAEGMARDRGISVAAARQELQAQEARNARLIAFGQDLSNGEPEYYGGLLAFEGKATLYWAGNEEPPLSSLPASLRQAVTVERVPRPAAELAAERAALRRQLAAAGIKANVAFDIEKGWLTLSDVADLPALAKAAREGRITLPGSIDIMTSGASVTGRGGQEAVGRAEAQSRASSQFAPIMALVRETKVESILAGGEENGPPRVSGDAQASEVAAMLIDLGFTASRIAALREKGFDPIAAWIAQNGRSTPANRAILSRHVVVVEPVTVDAHAALGDGFRSSARVRVVETLKGPSRPGDLLDLRMVSGYDTEGAWQQSNEEPMLLVGLPRAFVQGTRWLLWLPDGLYQRLSRYAGNSPANGSWFTPWFSIAQVEGEEVRATRYDDRPYALADLRGELAPIAGAVTEPGASPPSASMAAAVETVASGSPGLLALGFEKAIDQTIHAGKPVCLSYSLDQAAQMDPPEALRASIAVRLKVPAYPGSLCGFGSAPFVKATGETAMLYTAQFKRERQGTWLLRASAIYGNLGAEGQGYRLHRTKSGWRAEPTGERFIS